MRNIDFLKGILGGLDKPKGPLPVIGPNGQEMAGQDISYGQTLPPIGAQAVAPPIAPPVANGLPEIPYLDHSARFQGLPEIPTDLGSGRPGGVTGPGLSGEPPPPPMVPGLSRSIVPPANPWDEYMAPGEPPAIEPVSTPPANELPAIAPRTAESQAQDIINKDYSPGEWQIGDEKTNSLKKARKYAKAKGVDVQTLQTKAPGANYDKKHSGWEKAAGAALGFLQGGVVGAIQGGRDRHLFENMKDRQALGTLLPKVEAQQGIEKTNTDLALKRAQTATIPIDDQIKRDQLTQRTEAARETRKSQARNKIASLKWLDPKNAVHASLLEAAELKPADVQGWDDRNPYTKVVAGTTYVYDRTDQTFKPSDLPVDESATLTDYKVKMPNGEFRTYKVSQKDAARFATQMHVLGAQIEAADRRQQSQQQFTEKQLKLKHEMAIKLADYKAAIKDKQMEKAAALKVDLVKLQNDFDAD